MSDWKIYYNPKCGTCRKALTFLKAKGVKPDIVEYLKTPPTARELEAIVKKAGGNAHAIVRPKEDAYAAEGLSAGSKNADVVAAIVKHPILLQRPIVVAGDRAVVARPAENLEVLF